VKKRQCPCGASRRSININTYTTMHTNVAVKMETQKKNGMGATDFAPDPCLGCQHSPKPGALRCTGGFDSLRGGWADPIKAEAEGACPFREEG
jgi:hypothetical protein